MILVRAIQANIEMIGALLAAKIGTVTTATVTGQGVTTIYTGYSSFLETSSQLQDLCDYRRGHKRSLAPASFGTNVLPISLQRAQLLDTEHGIPDSTRDWWNLGCLPLPTGRYYCMCLTDASFLIIGGIIFAIFWIETTGMGPKSVADEDPQLRSSGSRIQKKSRLN